MNKDINEWFYAISNFQLYHPGKDLRHYDIVDDDLYRFEIKEIVQDLFQRKMKELSSGSVGPTDYYLGIDRVHYIYSIMTYYEYWLMQLEMTDMRAGEKISVNKIKTSHDSYGNRMNDFVVTLDGFHKFGNSKKTTSKIYVQLFAKVVSEVKPSIFKKLILKYFDKMYHPEDVKFVTKFAIVSRIWVDPIHYYDVYVRDIPINDQLITNINNDYEGDVEYERRIRHIGPRGGISGI